MKKIYIFLAVLVFLTGCDDGDMTFKALNFEDFNGPTRCSDESNTVYFIRGTEALVFSLPPSLFPNAASAERIIPVGSGTSYSMVYRNYSGTVSNNTLCNSSGTPNVLEEWGGSGNLSIISTEERDATGKLLSYKHDVTLVSATFNNNGQEVTIVNNFLGTFTTTLTFEFQFDLIGNDVNAPDRCDNDDSILYKINGDEALQLNIASSYFVTHEPQTIEFNGGNAVLYFIKYATTIDENVLCAPSPTNPEREQVFIASAGTVEITWELDTDNFEKHIIRFRNLVLRNNNSTTGEVYRPQDNDTVAGAGYYRFGPNPVN